MTEARQKEKGKGKTGISTARNGDPSSASRGAAVARAKADLGDVIDARLGLDVEKMELEYLASAIGCSLEQVRGKLDAATLDELGRWTKAVMEPQMNTDRRS